MPVIPNSVSLTGTSVDILNAIRNSASTNYRDYVPEANNTAQSVREIGAVIMQYPALQNEFLSALVNRIGMVLITSKMYSNPWTAFKRGYLEFGENIEEIFVNIAKPFQYDVNTAENEVFKREIPDVRAAFHTLNYQKFYKATIQNRQLRQAFLSWAGIEDLIAKIVDSMYTAAANDEFLTMKYLLARHILNGQLFPTQISSVTSGNMKAIVSDIKTISNKMTFMSDTYNMTGVETHTPKDDQYIIVNSSFDAVMDVEVLAAAFNMSKADFVGHRVLIDNFGALDNDRLNYLFANDPNYTALTSDEITALNAIPAVLVDRDFFMIFDNLSEFTEQFNGQGLYWNYWYHVWKTFSVSPFANCTVFVPGAPGVTSVTVSPSTASSVAGQTVQYKADVVTTNFASKAVEWSATTKPPVGTCSSASASATSLTVTYGAGKTVAKDSLTGYKFSISDTQYTVTGNTAKTGSSSGTSTVTITPGLAAQISASTDINMTGQNKPEWAVINRSGLLSLSSDFPGTGWLVRSLAKSTADPTVTGYGDCNVVG